VQGTLPFTTVEGTHQWLTLNLVKLATLNTISKQYTNNKIGATSPRGPPPARLYDNGIRTLIPGAPRPRPPASYARHQTKK
jgi:hypothetical protein